MVAMKRYRTDGYTSAADDPLRPMHTFGMEIAIGYVFLLQKYVIIVLSAFGKSSMFFLYMIFRYSNGEC